MTTVKSVTEEKKAQKLIRFHSANNINNEWGVGRKNKIQKNLQKKSKHKKNKCFS